MTLLESSLFGKEKNGVAGSVWSEEDDSVCAATPHFDEKMKQRCRGVHEKSKQKLMNK